jgi:hypothetical protein
MFLISMYALPQHQRWLNTTVFLQYKTVFKYNTKKKDLNPKMKMGTNSLGVHIVKSFLGIRGQTVPLFMVLGIDKEYLPYCAILSPMKFMVVGLLSGIVHRNVSIGKLSGGRSFDGRVDSRTTTTTNLCLSFSYHQMRTPWHW